MATPAKNKYEIFRILPMRIEDFDEVLSLWKRTDGVGTNESDTRPNIQLYLERNPQMSFVARTKNGLVGAVLCGHDGRRGYLHHLAVCSEFRGRGIGKALLNSCVRQLAQAGILKCNIFVYANNHHGEAFWVHHGWEKREDLCMMQFRIGSKKSEQPK